MVTGLESNLLDGLIGVFGGNVILLSLLGFVAIAIIMIGIFKVPFYFNLPIFGFYFLLSGYLIPEARIIFAILAGGFLGTFIYGLWRGG